MFGTYGLWHPVTDAARTAGVISARLRCTGAQQAQILGHFIKGGDLTAGAIMHTVTSTAQVQADGDAAWDLENTALEALSLAASR